jgi:hypothetical protein
MGKKDVESVIEEAREGFDLRARLIGANTLTKTVKVYTDTATGRELGGSEDRRTQNGIVVGRRRWGVQGRLEELGLEAEALGKQEEPDVEQIKAIEDESAALVKKSKTLLAKLEKSALVFTLRAVPELIIRDTRRKAKANLNIKGKGAQGREEDLALEFTILLLAASVSEWTDNASGTVLSSLTDQQARDLNDLLPPGQFDRLDRAMIELSFEAQIANSGTDDADF